MFGLIARKVIAHPWQTIAVWAISVVLIIVFSPNLANYTTGNQQSFLPDTFESVQAQAVGAEYFPTQSGAAGSLIVTRSDGAPLTPADQQQAGALATTLQGDGIDGVAAVQATPQSLSADGKVFAIQVAFAGQPGDDQVNSAVGAVRADAAASLRGSDLDSELTGNAAIQVDTTSAFDHADTIITIATVVLIMGLLGLIFRSPIISVIPIVVIGIVLQVVTGITAALADWLDFQVSTSLQSILVVVLFGIGTDYIVFLLFRYRESVRSGASHQEALVFATTVVGRVIGSSALTVIGAFAALLLAKLGSLSTLAPGLIVAVAAMLITTLTLIPAIFALLGRHLFWPLGAIEAGARSPFPAIGAFTARRPALVAGGVAIVLIVLAVFSTGYRPTYNTLAELPSDTPSQQAFNKMSASFPPGTLSPTQVYAVGADAQPPAPAGPAPLDPNALAGLGAALAAVPGVASVTPPKLNADGTAALINVILVDDPFSTDAIDLVQGPVRDAAHGAMPGGQVLVGGQTSTYVDVREQLRSDTRLVFPVAAVIIFLILALLLTSLLAPLNLVVCVALTFAATLGGVVLVFLDAASYSGIDFTIPIVLYLFVVAIGTDYNILISARLHEEFRGGHSPRESVRIAIANDAPTVAAAGVILAFTFASLMLTGIANLVELGFGVALGIAIAAFGMAPLLVPALSALQKRPFWWPTRASGAPAAPAVDAPPSASG